MKFELGEFLKTAAATYAGGLQGQMEGRQLLQQRQAQEFKARQTFLGQLQQQQSERDRLLVGQIGQMEPGSQATLLQGILSRPDPMQAQRQDPYLRRTGIANLIPQQPQGLAPGAVPPGGRSFQAPGIGLLTLKGGPGKEQIAQRGAAVKAMAKTIEDSLPILVDPTQRANATTLLGELRASDVTTREGFESAGNLLTRAAGGGYGGISGETLKTQRDTAEERKLAGDEKSWQEVVTASDQMNDESWWSQVGNLLEMEKSIGARRGKRGTPFVRFGPHEKDIQAISALQESGNEAEARLAIKQLRGRLQSNLSPKDEATIENQIWNHLKMLSPLSRTPELVRSLYEKSPIAYKVKDLPDEALQFGHADLWKRHAQAKSDIARWVNLDQKAQEMLIKEIEYLQNELGIDIPISPEVTPRLTDEQKERIRASQERTRIANERWEAEQKKLEKERTADHDKLKPRDKAAIEAAEKKLARIRADIRQRGIQAHKIDLSREARTPREQVDWDLVQQMIAAETALNETQNRVGLKVTPPDHDIWYKVKTQPTAREPEKPKTPAEKAVDLGRRGLKAAGEALGIGGAQAAPAAKNRRGFPVWPNAKRLRVIDEMVRIHRVPRAVAVQKVSQYAPD